MGYTHYFTAHGWHSAEWQAAWEKLVPDASIIMEASEVLICSSYSERNGLEAPIADLEEGICFNGVADDGHETFWLSRKNRDGFVKTLQKPYDVPVACILLRAHMLAPKNFELSSDGMWNDIEWIKARKLYKELWPTAPVRCPWGENDDDEENDEASADMHQETSPIQPPPDITMDISDVLKKLHIDLKVAQSIKSTVLEVDFSQVSMWLSCCEDDNSHDDCKASPIQWQNLSDVRFKVIDIHRRCIINAPDEGCSFIALTYVWGGVDQPKLSETTASLLMREGGLDLAWSKIPMTIRDAILVCEQLGERYLWVDALCIMQDSARDMKLQILRMRQIYSAAKCTIAAVSAETAETGLLGNIPAGKSWDASLYESEDDLNSLLESAPWSSRAWCYQEKVLSHRLIFFTSNGVYMQCKKGTFNGKGTRLDESKSFAPYNAVGGMLSIEPGKDLESYLSAVEYYCQRKLTKQEDRMNAFQGVLRRYGGVMDGKASSFCYGLPIFAFDQTFCWKSRRHNPHLRNAEFPSWSWLGWNDQVIFDRKIIEPSRTCQMIYSPDSDDDDYQDACYIRKPTSNPMFRNTRFGFPVNGGSGFYNSPKRHLWGSVTDLRIAHISTESDGSNGLYAVFPIKCGQQSPPLPPPPQKKSMTLLDFLTQPMPKPNFMDAETAAAPSVPIVKQAGKEHDPTEHDNHTECEAQTPFGYIWLDKEWREKHPDYCIMEFMAVTGDRDKNEEEKWIITMLMCLQRMKKNEHFWAWERVQVMTCNIAEQQWMKAGAKTKQLKLT